MPAEGGRPTFSETGAQRPKDTVVTPVDLEAEYLRIQEGVLAEMARVNRGIPIDLITSTSDMKAYNVLVTGFAEENQIMQIAGRIPDVGPLSQFAVAFQRVAHALRPLENGIAEVPDKTRTLYKVVPLRMAKGTRIRDDVPTKEDEKTRQAVRAIVVPSAIALLKIMPHDLSVITKEHGGLVTVRHLFPDPKEQHEYLLDALLKGIDDLFDTNKPKNGREVDSLRRLRGKTAEEFKAELKNHFSERNRRNDEKERKAHKKKK